MCACCCKPTEEKDVAYTHVHFLPIACKQRENVARVCIRTCLEYVTEAVLVLAHVSVRPLQSLAVSENSNAVYSGHETALSRVTGNTKQEELVAQTLGGVRTCLLSMPVKSDTLMVATWKSISQRPVLVYPRPGVASHQPHRQTAGLGIAHFL